MEKEREEDKVPALAVAAQSSSGPFSTASIYPEVPRLPFPSIDPVGLMEEALCSGVKSEARGWAGPVLGESLGHSSCACLSRGPVSG